jgi:hypothetical protein
MILKKKNVRGIISETNNMQKELANSPLHQDF